MTALADAARGAPPGGAAPPAEGAASAVAAARAAAADAAVAARHPDLPGLAVLLDADRLRSVLAALAGPEPAATAVLERLRVKPGASVRAGVRLEGPDGRTPRVLVTARAGRDWDVKAHKEVDAAHRSGLPAHVAPETRLLLAPAASDRALRGLARLRPDTGAPVRRPRGAPRGGDVVATTLAHNPGRRWVGRLDPAAPGAEGEPLLVRRHAGGHVEVLAWVPGRPWSPDDGPDAVRARLDEHAAGRHGTGPGAAGEARRRLERAVTAAAGGLGALDDDWGARAARLLLLLRRLLAHEPLAPAHGDLSPDQVVVAPDGAVHVLDWDRAGLLPRGWDAASWEAAQRALAPGVDPVPLGGRAAPAVVAATHLVRAVEPFRRRHPAWPDGVEVLLGVAEDALRGAR
ncbi:hypothetical protein WDV85_13755 [Pseudokineococcus sp. 5B2Z-1]|uniref:hypothetical protein n=1 Tax=Pseudokineococcus sp. 5B2Z-1 TaxID=3132744 RepID=UPI0030A55670